MSMENPLAARAVELEGQIVSKMKSKGADPNSPAQLFGVGVIKIINSTDMDGFISLTLDCKREWGMKVGMDHFPVDYDLDEVLEVYGYITDNENRGELSALDEAEELRAADYIRQNRLRLLSGLVDAMETSLRQFDFQDQTI